MMRASGDLSNCRGDFHRSFRRNSYYFARNTLNLIIKKDSSLYLALRWKISRDNWIARRNLILGQEPLVFRSWVKVNQFLLCMLNASLEDAVSAKSINLWGEWTAAIETTADRSRRKRSYSLTSNDRIYCRSEVQLNPWHELRQLQQFALKYVTVR